MAITDIPKSTATVLPLIADHNAVLVKLPLPEVLEKSFTRTVWDLRKAEWSAIEHELTVFDWSALRQGTAEDSLSYFLEVLWNVLIKHIPRKDIVSRKSTHPWLNERCRNALVQKNNAEGTNRFEAERLRCIQILGEERVSYVQSIKLKLQNLRRHSKQWWRINRELLRKKASMSSIPTLRDESGWLTDAKQQADTFARTFSDKAKLPAEVVDTPFFGSPENQFDEVVVFRSRACKKLLKKLDESKATGNDNISAVILKKLAACIAMPFTIVCRRLFHEGCWPTIWKFHLIVPIFKKGAAFKPGNYRGVHLTTILSKIAEKLICARLFPFLQKNAFGDNQWAFSTGLGCRDLVTMLVMSWILAICTGKKVGGFLSDISGAFDRVNMLYMLGKLHYRGVGPQFLSFLASYLAPRRGQVIVQGARSDEFEIANSVYQGTVLGPCLWNTFFADVSVPAKSTGGKEAMFADDLNVFQEFDRLVPLPTVVSTLETCRTRVHSWGRTNRVTFDPGKEHLVVMHPSLGHGAAFRLLGCTMDTDLRMHSAIEDLMSKIRPKITAILRTRAYYKVPDLIGQFKTHIWGLIEAHNGGYFHATSSLLDKIEHAQSRFLRELEVSPEQAFLDFNFAPPRIRRNIAVLGLSHTRVIGKCHPSFQRLLS